ncbi:MAG: hypothetical protein DYG91_11640 [Chloroflexi bacterium CFX7]|nr:MAG: hypothetical protein EDM76_07535 [bacterium]MCE7929132.1 hypothetical protein [Chloroflexi bacterium CFX7]MCK6563598.1 hypothetical protein [Dehalococcoidia bacterium]MCL4232577.1 hypothetical protein [Dehalococcoidia bacterium]
MTVFSERPRDMRSQTGDSFDFGAAQRQATQFPGVRKPTTGRGRKLATAGPGETAAIVMAAFAAYWVAPALMSRRQKRRK